MIIALDMTKRLRARDMIWKRARRYHNLSTTVVSREPPAVMAVSSSVNSLRRSLVLFRDGEELPGLRFSFGRNEICPRLRTWGTLNFSCSVLK